MDLLDRSKSAALWMITVGVFCVPSIAAAQEATTVSGTTTEANTVSDYSFEVLPNTDVLGDFVVGPGKVELEIPAGESRTVELFVTNRTGETRDFLFEVEDIAGSSDASKSVILLGDDRGPYALQDYLSVPHEPIRIAHANRVRVPVTISVPADAEPGGRYGSVLVSTVSVEAAPQVSGVAPKSAIVARIGTLFFITVPGEIMRDGALTSFGTIPERTFFSSGPITFSLLYDNKSTVHLNPYGEIRIRNMFGEEVGFIILEPWFALPQSLRLREVVWDRTLLWGRYTATAYVNRGYDDIVDSKEIVFWVIPWQPLIGACAVLFILVFLIRLFFKKFEFRTRS